LYHLLAILSAILLAILLAITPADHLFWWISGANLREKLGFYKG
jgi:DMSO/TMAO reductase YedYZ heme-binding membrane subunit